MLVLAPALFFAGCIKPNNEAFVAPPDLSEANTLYVDSFTTNQETYLIDSLNTTSRQILLVGGYGDGITGNVECNSYFQFLPISYPLTYPDSLIKDSLKATITLRYDYNYGNETNMAGKDEFALYKLTENLSGDKSYYFNSPATSHESDAYLTTLSAVREKRLIKLDAKKLAFEIFDTSNRSRSFSNDQQFLSNWKGFALKSLGSNPQVTRFDLRDSSGFPPSFLVINYYNIQDGIPVRGEMKFRTNGTTAQYYTIKQDYTGTPFQSIQPKKGLSAAETNSRTVVQAGTGLSTKILIPGLNSWRLSQTKQIKIFKAELVITQDPSETSLFPPDFLRINLQDKYFAPKESDPSKTAFNDARIFSLLQSGAYNSYAAAQKSISSQVFDYNKTSRSYSCNMTRHIQGVVDGTIVNTDFNLYSAEWGNTVNRLILPKGSVKLKIFYFPI